jgi:catechol-2,3-dioxygenase
MTIKELNHAVLYVSDLDRSVDFYTRVLGFVVVTKEGGFAAFLRAGGSSNHHDLGLFAVGKEAPRPQRGEVGLYHLAWEIDTIEALAEMGSTLAEANTLVGMSDHGVSKSLYGQDPDGIEFEVMWRVPHEDWGAAEHRGIVRPLDLEREVRRYGRATAASRA